MAGGTRIRGNRMNQESSPGPRIPRTFISLRHGNYRLYFLGQLVSLVGFWMQHAAQSWLIYELTGSKAMLGVAGLVANAPIPLLSIVGGILADRYPKRRILVFTHVAAALPALALALLVFTGQVQVWHILVLAASLGLIAGIDMPVRQAFVVDLVGRDDLMNAIALNSALFHGARIVGPALAGLAIAAWGPGPCFLYNGLSYGAIVAALVAMRFEVRANAASEGGKGNALEGFHVVARVRLLRILLLLTLTMGVFGSSLTTLLPAFAKDILDVGAGGYGALLSALGAGALCGSLLVATAQDSRHSRILMGVAMAVFSVSAFGFALSDTFWVSALFLVLAGTGVSSFFSSSNTLIQTSVDDDVRGRVMGVYTLVFGTMLPLGAVTAGFLGEVLGPGRAVMVGAAACALTAIAAYFLLVRVRDD